MKTGWIFLDFDGVLNSDAFYTRNEKASKIGDVDPRAVRCLNDLVKRSGARVVISSNWRHNMSLKELKEVLVERGFKYPKKVVAKTPDLGHQAIRGYEILAFLKKRRALKAPFVVLDDTMDMDGVEDCFVRTRPKEGLLPSHVEKALLILSRTKDGEVVKPKKSADQKKRTKKTSLLPIFRKKKFTWDFS
jgi:hypothetical protein